MRSLDKGRLIGAVIVIALVILYAVWGVVVRATADEERGDLLLWVHDGDAAPGGTIPVRLMMVRAFGSNIGGAKWDFGGHHGYVTADGDSDTVDFHVPVPARAEPGDELALTLERGRFVRSVRIYTPAMALARKLGRAAAAVLALIGFGGLLVAATRFVFRRQWRASRGWYVLLVPHVVIGYFAFAHPIAAAIGTHALPIYVGLIVLWCGLLAVPGRVRLRRGFPCYRAASALIQSVEGNAYRGARVQETIEAVATLEAAWSAAGMLVLRRRDELVLTLAQVGYAVVPVARSETFGGEPLEVFTPDRRMASTILQAAANVLGPLRSTIPGETGELVFEREAQSQVRVAGTQKLP